MWVLFCWFVLAFFFFVRFDGFLVKLGICLPVGSLTDGPLAGGGWAMLGNASKSS